MKGCHLPDFTSRIISCKASPLMWFFVWLPTTVITSYDPMYIWKKKKSITNTGQSFVLILTINYSNHTCVSSFFISVLIWQPLKCIITFDQFSRSSFELWFRGSICYMYLRECSRVLSQSLHRCSSCTTPSLEPSLAFQMMGPRHQRP